MSGKTTAFTPRGERRDFFAIATTVMLRGLWGLALDEVAEVLKVSRSTVDRDWRFARTWLAARI